MKKKKNKKTIKNYFLYIYIYLNIIKYNMYIIEKFFLKKKRPGRV